MASLAARLNDAGCLKGRYMHVFIDTNIFLNFYHYGKGDLDELHKLFVTHENGFAHVYLTGQVYNEFMRNRENKIVDALKRFKEYKSIQLPTFMKNYKNYREIISLSQKLDRLHNEIISKINKDILDNNLLADQLIQEIFKKHDVEEITVERYNWGKMRVELGNPPGKNKSLGDAVNWGILLDKVPDGQDLHLISADGDFYSKLDEKEPHPVLLDEWRRLKKSNLYVYRELPVFMKKHFNNGVDLVFDKEKKNLIQKLFTSKSYACTHDLIYELDKYLYFSLQEVEENSQFGAIIRDKDISDFLNRVAIPRRSEIENVQHIQILDDVLDEQRTRN